MRTALSKLTVAGLLTLSSLAIATPSLAADYTIDTQGAHASVNFQVSHLGIGFVSGRFDTFSGTFSFDESAPEASKVSVEIDTNSVSSNHAERDKHLRSGDFLNVSGFPTATFESTSIEVTGDKTAKITGDLTLRGVTKPVVIDTQFIAAGKDPWGGERAGFTGTTEFAMQDFGIETGRLLGENSKNVQLTLFVEGVKQ